MVMMTASTPFSADLNNRNLNIIDQIEGGRIVSIFSLCLSCQQDPSHTLITILSFLLWRNTLHTHILSVGNSKFKFRRLLIVSSVTEILHYGKFKWFDFNIYFMLLYRVRWTILKVLQFSQGSCSVTKVFKFATGNLQCPPVERKSAFDGKRSYF